MAFGIKTIFKTVTAVAVTLGAAAVAYLGPEGTKECLDIIKKHGIRYDLPDGVSAKDITQALSNNKTLYGSVDYEKFKEDLQSLGLNETQIDKIEAATKDAVELGKTIGDNPNQRMARGGAAGLAAAVGSLLLLCCGDEQNAAVAQNQSMTV